MTVVDPQGRKIRVRRRWLPWRRRVREVESLDFGAPDLGDDLPGVLLFLLVLIALPFVAVLVLLLGELLLLLLLLPVAVLLRVAFGRPWVVEAVEVTRGRPLLWSEPVRGWTESGLRVHDLAAAYERGEEPVAAVG